LNWDRRFRFKGSTSGLAQDRRSRFANQACFGQAGAITMILHSSIVLHWGNSNIDLFATSLNFKVTTFVSPVPDPRAYAVDAMSLSWEGMFAYAFPHSDCSPLFFTR
jgi:hypothetical protein